MSGKSKRIHIILAVFMLGALFAVSAGAQGIPGPESASGVQPIFVGGNPTCASLIQDFYPGETWNNGLRIEAGVITVDTTYPDNGGYFPGDPSGPLEATITAYDGTYVSWASNIGVDVVIVKGGPNADAFVYVGESFSDGNLHAPIDPNNDKPYGISHVDFCYDVEPTGRITIKKVTEPADDQTDFEFDGSGGIGQFPLNDGGSRTFDVSPDTYTITELDPGEDWYVSEIECVYPETMSEPSIGSQSVTINDLSAGDEVTCTFYNTKVSTMIIEKQTIPDGAPDLFTFEADTVRTLSDGQSFTMITGPGSYTAKEDLDLMPEGWSLTSIDCNDEDSSGNIETGEVTFNVAAGETVKCTFTNTKEPQPETGTITIKKVTDQLAEGIKFLFEASEPIGNFPLEGGQSAEFTVPVGDYEIPENADEMPQGWFLEDIVCNDDDVVISIPDSGGAVLINLQADDEITCTFYNTQEQQPDPGRIEVIKEVIGDAPEFDWQFQLNGEDFTLPAAGSNTSFDNLQPGVYDIVERDYDEWELVSLVCNDPTGGTSVDGHSASVDLAPGETVTCTFTNARALEPDVEIFKEQSLDNSSWTTDTLWVSGGDTIFYQLTVENLFNAPVDLTLTDPLDDLLDYDSGWLGTNTDDYLEYTWELGALDTLTFSFAVTVADTVFPGDVIANTASVQLSTWNEPKDSNTVYAKVKDPVPEPATVALLGTGLFGIFVLARRRRRQKK